MKNLKFKSNYIDVVIGKNLSRIRKDNKISLTDFANILEVSCQQVQKYEKGINRLSASRLYILSNKFGLPLDIFFLGLKENDASNDFSINYSVHTQDQEDLLKFWSKIKSKNMKADLFVLLKEMAQK